MKSKGFNISRRVIGFVWESPFFFVNEVLTGTRMPCSKRYWRENGDEIKDFSLRRDTLKENLSDIFNRFSVSTPQLNDSV